MPGLRFTPTSRAAHSWPLGRRGGVGDWRRAWLPACALRNCCSCSASPSAPHTLPLPQKGEALCQLWCQRFHQRPRPAQTPSSSRQRRRVGPDHPESGRVAMWAAGPVAGGRTGPDAVLSHRPVPGEHSWSPPAASDLSVLLSILGPGVRHSNNEPPLVGRTDEQQRLHKQ